MLSWPIGILEKGCKQTNYVNKISIMVCLFFTFFLSFFLLVNWTSPNWPIIFVRPLIQNWRGYLVLMVLYVLTFNASIFLMMEKNSHTMWLLIRILNIKTQTQISFSTLDKHVWYNSISNWSKNRKYSLVNESEVKSL